MFVWVCTCIYCIVTRMIIRVSSRQWQWYRSSGASLFYGTLFHVELWSLVQLAWFVAANEYKIRHWWWASVIAGVSCLSLDLHSFIIIIIISFIVSLLFFCPGVRMIQALRGYKDSQEFIMISLYCLTIV